MRHDLSCRQKAKIVVYTPPSDLADHKGVTWVAVLQSRRVLVYEHVVTGEVWEFAPVPGLDLAIPADAREPSRGVQAHLMSLLAQLLIVCRDGHRFDRLIILGDDDRRAMFRRYCDARIRQLVALEDSLPVAEFISREAGRAGAAAADTGSCTVARIKPRRTVREGGPS